MPPTLPDPESLPATGWSVFSDGGIPGAGSVEYVSAIPVDGGYVATHDGVNFLAVDGDIFEQVFTPLD